MKSPIKILVISYFFLSCCMLFASQSITIKGKIKHANTYQEINKVNIFIQNTTIGTTSNIDGSFELKINNPDNYQDVTFRHISFYTFQLSIRELMKKNTIIYLTPKVIQLPEISVVKEKDQPEIFKDIPQPISVIKAKHFDIEGYTDPGDLLFTEQSIKIEEELSGKKTIAIRGGNPDDVTVLYNGVKMNNMYDNVFDLTLINLDDIEQIEIIRGSNTALYGPEAISGIINFIPKLQKNYTARFQQKLGTYALGDWNLQLNHTIRNKANFSYSYKQGGTRRDYADTLRTSFLENKNTYQSASMVYNLSSDKRNFEEHNINAMYIRSQLDYENTRYNESLSDFNQMLSLRYNGLNKLNVVSSYHWLDNKQKLAYHRNFIDRDVMNRTFAFNVEKTFFFENLEILSAYQFEKGELDFRNAREIPDEESIGIESTLFSRNKHGLATIFKLHVPTDSTIIKYTDFDFTYRFDHVNNQYDDDSDRNISMPGIPQNSNSLNDNDWNKSTIKFSSYISAQSKFFVCNAYINFGRNVKFPTMFQQLSTFSSFTNTNQISTSPEENKSTEIGVDIIREIPTGSSINGMQFSANLFKNHFTNKFINYYLPHNPIAIFDNVQTAEISGLELKQKFFIYQNKLTLEFGTSLYSIPEKDAFPFKSDKKHIINISLEHAGYSVNLHWFNESEQIAWIRAANSDNLNFEFLEVSLPGYSNIDIHLSKFIEFKKFRIYANFSGRNLLDDDTVLQGIAIRDRRYYITFGVQY